VQIINTCMPKMAIMNPAETGDLESALTTEGTELLASFPWAAENGKSVPVLSSDLAPLLEEGAQALAADESLGSCDGRPEDIAVLCTTSGTTGTPKAAMHSQKALCAHSPSLPPPSPPPGALLAGGR